MTELNLGYLSNGLTTLVKTNGALVNPNGKTVKTENLIIPLITQKKKQETSDEVRKYQYGDNRHLDQI